MSPADSDYGRACECAQETGALLCAGGEGGDDEGEEEEKVTVLAKPQSWQECDSHIKDYIINFVELL